MGPLNKNNFLWKNVLIVTYHQCPKWDPSWGELYVPQLTIRRWWRAIFGLYLEAARTVPGTTTKYSFVSYYLMGSRTTQPFWRGTPQAFTLLYPTASSLPASCPVPCTCLNDWAKLHYTPQHLRVQCSSHSAATMKWDVSYCALITAGFCQMQLWRRIHVLQLRIDFGWLFLSTLWYLHKVQRIKRVNVLDLFKEKQLPVEVRNNLSVMYLV